MTDIKEDWLAWFTHFLIKNPLKAVVSLIMRLNKIYNQLKNYKNQLLEVLKKEQLIQNLKTIFVVLIQVIDIFGKYAWVIPLKNKKGVSIVNVLQEILNDSASSEAKSKGRRQSQFNGGKPNEIWVDKASEFYSNSF